MEIQLIVLLTIVLIIASVTDLRVQKIPNWLTFPTMLSGLIYHSFMNGLDGLLFSGQGLLLGVAILIIPFLMGGMGAGDAKLLGAVGAFLGPRGVCNAAIFTFIAGGIYTIVLLLIHRKVCRSLVSKWVNTLKVYFGSGCFVQTQVEGKPKLYYGLAIASGTFYTIWWQLGNQGYPL